MVSIQTSELRHRVAAKRAVDRARLLSPIGQRRAVRILGLLLLGFCLAGVLVASLALGAHPISFGEALQSLWSFDPANRDHLIIHDLRLPRTYVGIAVGICLGISGVLMQAISRNPLADPGLLGVNAGASFCVVLAIWLLEITTMTGLVWFAFFGAGAVSVIVYILGSMGRGAATPVRLTLAGAALSALLFALINAVLLTSQSTLEVFRFWAVGSLAGANGNMLVVLGPFIVVGVIAALWVATSLNAIALGDDTAKSLGTRLTLTRVVTLLSVTLLCGSSVAIAGPVGFVGLVVPHVARLWCGPDQRWLIFYAALLGPIVLIACDTIGRIILPPGEVQVGIMTALLGGPLFVAIVRRLRMAQL